jgi:hypothetical protein
VPKNQITQPCAAAKDRPWGDRKRVQVEAELEARYRRIGIAAVAAAAIARVQAGKLPAR